MTRQQRAMVAASAGGALLVLAALVGADVPALTAVDEMLGVAAHRSGQRRSCVPTLAARLTGLGRTPVVLGVFAGVVGVRVALSRAGSRVIGPDAEVGVTVRPVPPSPGRSAVFAVTAYGVSALSGELVRRRTGRRRPVRPRCPVDGPAFPSGHTTRATAGALVVVLLLWPVASPGGRVVLAGSAPCWPLAVAASRVLLSAHWGSDVVGGWLVAVTGVCGTAAVFDPYPAR